MKLIRFLKKKFDPIPSEFQHLAPEFEAEGKKDVEKIAFNFLTVSLVTWTSFSLVDYFYYPGVFIKLVIIRVIALIITGIGILLLPVWRDKNFSYWIYFSTGVIAAFFIELIIVVGKNLTSPYAVSLIVIMVGMSVVSWPTTWTIAGNALIVLIYYVVPLLFGAIGNWEWGLLGIAMIYLGIRFLLAHIQIYKMQWKSFYDRYRANEVAGENAKLYENVKHLNAELETYNQNLEGLVQEQVQEISEAQMAMIFALAKLAESRDTDTGTHLERVQILSRLLAEKLSTMPKYTASVTISFSNDLFYASPLHDIGKVGISDNILLKPAKLTSDEFEIMKQHAMIGAHTLQTVMERYPNNHFISMGISIARSHHEKWDGTGYPDGLAGEDIPFPARIVAIVDVYDALRTNRCYKSSLSHEESVCIILEGSGTHFDPDVVYAFRELEYEFESIRANMQE